MMPRLGEKYDIEIETISKPREEFTTSEYLELGLPKAPAVMLGDEIVVKGADASEKNLEAMICEKLGMPAPEPQKRGIFGRILKK
jgi:hypothetical protein